MIPDWHDYETNKISEDAFNASFMPIPFPGYVNNAIHPFGFCHALTHGVGNTKSNKWASYDSPGLFEKNYASAPRGWRYRTQDVTYIVNSSGYRTYEWHEINWKEAIVILGCSNTFGVGLDETETISSVLQELTGRQVVNLGYPAGSNDLILQHASTIFEKFGAPYCVVANWTGLDRFRLFSRENPVDLGPWNATNGPTELFKLLTENDYNTAIRNYYISRTMQALWQGRAKYISISYFEWSAHFMLADQWFKIDNNARDMVHPGYENSKEVAQYIKDKLDEHV